MLHRVPLSLLLMLLLGGCTSVTQHGDATLHDRTHFLGEMMDSLYLPHFSLSEKAIHSWEVRDLPVLGFRSMEVVVAVNDLDEPPSAPWQDAVILVEIHNLDGDVLLHQRIGFATLYGRGSFIYPRKEVSFPLDVHSVQFPTNYDVVVTVEKPSPRNSDHAWLHGMTIVRSR